MLRVGRRIVEKVVQMGEKGEFRVAIIGGGVAGLSAAYFLAKRGADVEVFEKEYLVYGASGRNSGGLTA